jgi:2-iminobutanoate/2-iminopropanoate deaminase
MRRMMMLERRAVQTGEAPAAIGPYSQAIVAGDLVFVSGQIPIDPSRGGMIESDAAGQAELVMRNIGAILEAAGSSLERVVKTTVYLADLGDFEAVNRVYGTFFRGAPPARATVQVSALPKGARVEIDAVALKGT